MTRTKKPEKYHSAYFAKIHITSETQEINAAFSEPKETQKLVSSWVSSYFCQSKKNFLYSYD